MSSETREAVDTVTMAGLLKALQVLHTHATARPEALPHAIERDVMVSIKQLDAGDFDYDVQAEGLAEALRLVQAVFRYARSQREIGATEQSLR